MPRLLVFVALLAAAPAYAAPREISGFSQSEWTGTIVAVDQGNKTVSVKGPDGDVEVVDAREARNLPQVKAGDVMKLRVSTRLKLTVLPKGQKAPEPGTKKMTARAKEGAKPAGTILTERTRVATIAALADDHVVLQRKDGEKHTFPVKDPEHLEGLAVGDTVVVVETSETAIAVDSPPAR
jgi:hypothetical protein